MSEAELIKGRLQSMTQNEFYAQIQEAVIAYVNHLISYEEWECWMHKLIERRQNNDL